MNLPVICQTAVQTYRHCDVSGWYDHRGRYRRWPQRSSMLSDHQVYVNEGDSNSRPPVTELGMLWKWLARGQVYKVSVSFSTTVLRPLYFWNVCVGVIKKNLKIWIIYSRTYGGCSNAPGGGLKARKISQANSIFTFFCAEKEFHFGFSAFDHHYFAGTCK